MRFLLKLALCAALALSAASAQEYSNGEIVVDQPWSRATPHGAEVAGGFFVIRNKGTTADRLISGSTEIAGRFEIHETRIEHGIARMRPLARGLEIKPGATIKFEPGGYHVMFMSLKRPLKEGERFKGTLVFERAGPIEIEFTVEAMGRQPARHGH